jgi:hypothetical protein
MWFTISEQFVHSTAIAAGYMLQAVAIATLKGSEAQRLFLIAAASRKAASGICCCNLQNGKAGTFSPSRKDR